jgi:hypothetical protein
MSIFKRKFNLVEPKPKLKERIQAMALDTNSKFVYTGGSDVLKTFKRYGFVPPTEYRDDYLFKINREANREENNE